MFTGIVESVGKITGTRSGPGGKRLRIEAGAMSGQCACGESIAVSGVCLTIASIAGDSLEFDVITETLNRSTLGSKRTGDHVNLERALGIHDRFDGHFVQGHVDGIGTVDRVQSSSREWASWFKPEEHLTPYVIPKGSIAVDGVSLTIAEVQRGAFSVALIPTTLERTTLASLAVGDLVNIESDIIARTVVHRLSEMSTGGRLTVERLREGGFA